MTVHFIVKCCTSEILSNATATTGHYKGDAMYFFLFCRASGTVYTAIEVATGHEVNSIVL